MNIQKLIKLNAIIFATLLFLSSCNKDYLIDSGKHESAYPGTIWKYLNDKPQYFDSLSRVVVLAGMENVLDKEEVTFFAPSSSCVYKSVKALNRYLYLRGRDTVKNLSQIKPAVWKEMLSLYIIKGKYLLKDVPQLDTTLLGSYAGQGYISYGNQPMNLGVIYNDAGGVKYSGYRQLFYSYINDFSNAAGSMLNVPVSSSDIQPTNGAVHVLKYQNHVFGFRTNDFIIKAIAQGIDKN